MYWAAVVLAGLLLGVGILLMKRVFFALSESTVGLLDAMLEMEQEDSVKQKMLISNLGRVLGGLFLFILQVFATFIVSALPLFVYTNFDFQTFNATSWNGWDFWLCLTIGSVIPFVVVSLRKKEADYSQISKLLHRLLLNNYNVSRLLFRLERKKVLKRATSNKNFVIVTGLARCGTTGLTTQLFESGMFHSLNYGNLPFLLSPNLWKKIYKPKSNRKKERAHGDKVTFGLDTVEALEEFFYKAHLQDSFISDTVLEEHEISEEIYDQYLDYQLMVKQSNPNNSDYYLAKNNNFLLRYPSVRKHDDKFVMLLMFRDPLDHAYSLLKQHRRFTAQQMDDGFVLEYMDWLGHHEFGLNHKPFHFGSDTPQFKEQTDDINYWLQVWLNYYGRAVELQEHQNTLYIDYSDFLDQPAALFASIHQSTGIDLSAIEALPFENKNKYEGEADEALLEEAQKVYSRLKAKRLVPSLGAAAD